MSRGFERVEKEGHALTENELLAADEVADELLLMGLRLREGFDLERFSDRTGREIQEEKISDLIEYGMIEWVSDQRIRATQEGALVLDAVIADLAG